MAKEKFSHTLYEAIGQVLTGSEMDVPEDGDALGPVVGPNNKEDREGQLRVFPRLPGIFVDRLKQTKVIFFLLIRNLNKFILVGQFVPQLPVAAAGISPVLRQC